MKKLNFNHHSISDWDFESAAYSLSAAHFITPPTALHPTADPPLNVLCRDPATLCLPEARLVSGFYITWTAARFGFTFRNQAPLGSANHDNCYWVWRYLGNVFIYRYVGGVETLIGFLDDPLLMDMWYHFRVTFWNGKNLAGDDALNILVEYRINGNWIVLGTIYDTLNMWKDSANNRVGLIFMYPITWCDDTEIWIKA